jgi:hypothetical protein
MNLWTDLIWIWECINIFSGALQSAAKNLIFSGALQSATKNPILSGVL